MRAEPAILPLVLDNVGYEVRGQHLINGLRVTIAAGPRTIILGPNGAGKSLLLRLCHGLIAPSMGTVVWHGPGAANARRRQAMVFQHPVMLRRSVAANVEYALKLAGLDRPTRAARTAEALERTGLRDLARRPARVLSGGEQQRLALARAWAMRPDVLFLDEPTASLDPAATRAVEQIVNAINQDGAKIVMTTHDLGQARRLADEIIFLHRGRLIERAPVTEFFQAPSTVEARAFVQGQLIW